MGSLLSPVLAITILTEYEKVAVTSLMENGFLKFCCRYVNRPVEIKKILGGGYQL